MAALRLDRLGFMNRGPIDLTIEPGECVALAGPSGSGKTLMLRAIADLDPHEGRVYLGEDEAQQLPAPLWRHRVGLLPAESQWWHDRVGDHFAPVPGETTTTGQAGQAERAGQPGQAGQALGGRNWLEELGFTDGVMDWDTSRLSTGEKQRLALVRLLRNRPHALLLDEPTASLDPENVDRVERLITELRHATRMPVLWVTHDAAQIARIADRGYRIDGQGRLAEQVHP